MSIGVHVNLNGVSECPAMGWHPTPGLFSNPNPSQIWTPATLHRTTEYRKCIKVRINVRLIFHIYVCVKINYEEPCKDKYVWR